MESIKFETLLGGFRDPNFGPMLMFGSGGKYVEVLDDTAIRSAYLTKEDIFEMISETKIGKLIQGVREEESVNIKNLIDVIYQIAFRFVNSNIMEFDINPLAITFDNQISAVDIRIKIM
jgi:acetyltransferase